MFDQQFIKKVAKVYSQFQNKAANWDKDLMRYIRIKNNEVIVATKRNNDCVFYNLREMKIDCTKQGEMLS